VTVYAISTRRTLGIDGCRQGIRGTGGRAEEGDVPIGSHNPGKSFDKLHDLIRSRYLSRITADFQPNGSYRTINMSPKKRENGCKSGPAGLPCPPGNEPQTERRAGRSCSHQYSASKLLRDLVDLSGSTDDLFHAMERAPSCATGPRLKRKAESDSSGMREVLNHFPHIAG